MHIFFEPSFSNENEYIRNIIDGLKNNGCIIVNGHVHNKKTKLIAYLKFLLSSKGKIYHVNWIENIVVEKNFQSRIKVLIWLTFVRFCHLRGKIVVWTMHNIVPHGCKDLKYANWFYNKWTKMVDLIVVHSNESKRILIENFEVDNDKICNVPHGGYSISEVTDCQVRELRNKYNINENEFVFLYFGQIDDYKNIPLLLESFETANINGTKLLVCGSLSHRLSKDNLNLIQNYSKKENIKLDLRFFEDEELSPLFNLANIVILPYSKKSMQNSGVAILSICNGKPILIPEFGYIRDIKNEPFIYSYSYESHQEHSDILIQMMRSVVEEFRRGTLFNDQEFEKKYARDHYDWDVIAAKIVSAYKIKLKGEDEHYHEH